MCCAWRAAMLRCFAGWRSSTRCASISLSCWWVVGRGRRSGSPRVYVHARPLLAGEPAWLWLTRDGRRESPASFGLWEPRVGLLAHVAAVNWVRLFVRSRAPGSEWVCERQLLRERQSQDQHVPDAVVLLEGRSHAVEVELTVKSRGRTEGILDELSAAHEVVLYFTTPATRAHLERIGGQARWRRLELRDLDQTIAALRR